MCSINGFTWVDEGLVRRMNKVTAHRGPDGTGAFVADGISLGHNRLAIIDLSPTGAQPMRTPDGRLSIVFNGEIYNFKELRSELEKEYSFRSSSDTEVILHAYAKYGPECVKKFNGIFAFAIWDARTNEVFLARDHAGVKPLYYFFDPSPRGGQSARLIFSSEIKAILEHDVVREVDTDAFNLYMRMLYVPEPYTMFKGVRKLPPAHYASFKNGTLSVVNYWKISDFDDVSSKDEAQERIRTLFKDSVRRQLISDRPVGVFLSGGLDSSAVLGAVAENASGTVKTYSVGFDVDVQREKFNADFMLAKQTAQHYGSDHHTLMISGKDIGGQLSRIAWHLDEPNANPTAGAIFLLSRLAKRDVAVVLGGDGADELFGGYRRYALSRVIRRFGKLPGTVRQSILYLLKQANRTEVMEKFSKNDPTDLFLSFLAQKEANVSALIRKDIPQNLSPKAHFARYFTSADFSGDFEKQFMNTDRQSWLTDESLLRSDKMTSGQGLEERVPILDHRLIELSCKIPTKWKITHSGLRSDSFKGKDIWRDAIAEYLPKHLLGEPKRGWFTPMAKWVRTELKEQVGEILSPANLCSEFFNTKEVQEMWRAHLESRKYNLNLIWAVVMWQLWYDTFIKNGGKK